jgi:hypothetical protein
MQLGGMPFGTPMGMAFGIQAEEIEPPRTPRAPREYKEILEPRMNANKNYLRSSALIRGSTLFIFSSVASVVPS